VNPRDYVSSWMLPYGQALLIKHLLIIPLLILALINGVLMKKESINPSPSIIKWIRAESFFVTLIFVLTGTLGIQSPPHDIKTMVITEGYSSLYKWFHPYITNGLLQLNVDSSLIFGIVLAGILLILMVVSFVLKKSALASILFGLFFVFLTYIALIIAAH
jgi:putative copper resistance protein D